MFRGGGQQRVSFMRLQPSPAARPSRHRAQLADSAGLWDQPHGGGRTGGAALVTSQAALLRASDLSSKS